MTIRHLEIFSAVCARGSVTQAAEILSAAVELMESQEDSGGLFGWLK